MASESVLAPEISPPEVPFGWLAETDDFADLARNASDCFVYFLLNVGDGDCQVLLLPIDDEGARRAIVVDAAAGRKLSSLVEVLAEEGLLTEPHHGRSVFPLVVGTHPHDDHIGGMPHFLDRFGNLIGEYWDPGYYHPSGVYAETMRAIEERELLHLQPTSGTSRFIGKLKVTALSPGMGLRSRFDSYGVHVNDASIALKIEFPAARIARKDENRHYLRLRAPWSLILGADAQMTSWAQATLDFPQLHHREGAVYRELRSALGGDPLRGDIFKVPHHASKHGLNIELVERIAPRISLISCSAGTGRYGFPHHLAVEAIREVRRPTSTTRAERPPDYELGIHYTCAVDDGPQRRPLGSIAVLVSPMRGSDLRIWRFGDEPGDEFSVDHTRELVPERSVPD